MMKFLIILFVALFAFSAVTAENTCSPWLGPCQEYENCCRHLVCHNFKKKCVPKGGLIVPGLDTRPVGPEPHIPGVNVYQ